MPAVGKGKTMSNGKGIIKNIYSSYRTLPSNVNNPEFHNTTKAYGVVTEEFVNPGQRMAVQKRNELAKQKYLSTSNWPDQLKHTYCYYWSGKKTDGIKHGLLVFYSYEYETIYVRISVGELTWSQVEKLETVIKNWHINGKLIIHNLDFPIEIEVF